MKLVIMDSLRITSWLSSFTTVIKVRGIENN